MMSDALCCKLDPGVNPIYAERYGGDPGGCLAAEAGVYGE
jgi:hypothetical protein